jgi:hypothetical protein
MSVKPVSDLTDLYSALDFAATTMAFSSRDWGKSEDLAMLYGVFVGWDEDPTGGDVDQGGALAGLAQRYGWTPDDVALLRRRRAAVRAFDINRIADLAP